MGDLISKLQAAPGPLSGKDVEECIRLSPWYANTPSHDPLWNDFVRALQGSIDAALALAERVLPGCKVLVGLRQTPDTLPWARVGEWSAPDAAAPTLPLAITLATLLALQSQEPK